MTMKSTYTVSIKVSASFDPGDPKQASAAMAFIAKISEGNLVEIPEGVDATVTAESPKLQNRREK